MMHFDLNTCKSHEEQLKKQQDILLNSVELQLASIEQCEEESVDDLHEQEVAK